MLLNGQAGRRASRPKVGGRVPWCRVPRRRSVGPHRGEKSGRFTPDAGIIYRVWALRFDYFSADRPGSDTKGRERGSRKEEGDAFELQVIFTRRTLLNDQWVSFD